MKTWKLTFLNLQETVHSFNLYSLFIIINIENFYLQVHSSSVYNYGLARRSIVPKKEFLRFSIAFIVPFRRVKRLSRDVKPNVPVFDSLLVLAFAADKAKYRRRKAASSVSVLFLLIDLRENSRARTTLRRLIPLSS